LARLALAEGRYGPAAKLATSAGDLSLVAYVAWRLGGSAAGIAASERALNGTPDPGQTAREHSVDQLTALLLQGALEVQAGDLGAAKATAVRFSWPDSSGLDRAKRRAAKSLEGLIAAASGQQERAVAEHEGAVALLSRDVAYNVDQSVGFCIMAATQALTLYQAARQYEAAGDSAKALGLFQRLIALNAGRLNHPDLYALSWCAAGRILEGQGNVDEARRCYAKFLDLWKNADSGLPEVEDARARLALLEGR
jgi:tetratricopeptide (TPR) repeat protein